MIARWLRALVGLFRPARERDDVRVAKDRADRAAEAYEEAMSQSEQTIIRMARGDDRSD